jgi:hypothetical protein
MEDGRAGEENEESGGGGERRRRRCDVLESMGIAAGSFFSSVLLACCVRRTASKGLQLIVSVNHFIPQDKPNLTWVMGGGPANRRPSTAAPVALPQDWPCKA